MTHDEMIAVIQAHQQGKPIEMRHKNVSHSRWLRILDPRFEFGDVEYRVMREPRVRWCVDVSTRSTQPLYVVTFIEQGEADRYHTHMAANKNYICTPAYKVVEEM